MTKDNFNERFRLALRMSGMSQSQLASIIGVSQPAIQKLVSGATRSTRKTVQIANALNVDPYWLTAGVGEMIKKNTDSNGKVIGAIGGWDNKTPLNEDEIEVPFYKNVRLSNVGFSDDIEDYNNHKLRLSRSTMKRHGIDENSTVCLTVDGDSMEPVFRDGATVAIDQTDTHVRDGKIYAINHDGLLRIKMLEKLPAGQIKIKSYNIGYDDEIVSHDDISVLGRVWWQSSIID